MQLLTENVLGELSSEAFVFCTFHSSFHGSNLKVRGLNQIYINVKLLINFAYGRQSLLPAQLPTAQWTKGMRFPAPGSSSHCCSVTGEEWTSQRDLAAVLSSVLSPSWHEMTVEEEDSSFRIFWRGCFWRLGDGPWFLLSCGCIMKKTLCQIKIWLRKKMPLYLP